MPQADYINQDELSKIYGTGSMEALGQGAQQAGLSQLFQQQQGQKNALENQRQTLANQFSEAQNPQLLEQQSLQNIGLGNQNVLGGIGARRAAANEGMQLSEDQKKFALTATDQDLQAAIQHAQAEMNSGDPRRMSEASKILDFTTAARTAKAKAAADLVQEQARTQAHLAGIGMQTGAQERMNQANIEAGKFNRAGKSSQGLMGIQEAVQSGKMTAEKAAVALHGAAMFEADPDVKQKYEAMARQYEQFAMNQRNAAAGGKLDIGAATGMPTQTIAPALGAGVTPAAPAPQGPQKGQIYKGHVFLGGDPSNKANWKAQ